jgi:microsomal dipeptidase-like Zn-dependent dipeptidase
MAPFCNHAYGIQFISNKSFFPIGSGITNWGKEIITRMLEKKILADVKHMSLWSRWQLYSMHRDPNNPNKYIAPILCTHAGLTGQSISDRVKYLFRKPLDVGDVYEVVYLKPKSPYIKDTYFNCSSINLYNEDVEAILLSEGLIGLSFDQRILGFPDENVLRDVNTPNDVEYISEQEANFFFGPNPSKLPVWKNDSKVWTAEEFSNYEPSLNPVLHPLFFINQVIHILTVAKNNPNIGVQKACKQICIGTDYDGLINSIDNCKQVDKLDAFKQLMLSKLKGLLKNAGLSNDGINIPEFVDDLFYNNGRDFVIKRLKAMGK